MAYTGVVFPFKHNWAMPVIETLEWLTDLIPKRSGLEQRIRLRPQPRRTLEYNILTGGAANLDMRRRFDACLWSSQDKNIVVPIWQDAQRVGDGNTLTTTSLFTTTEGRDYDANGYVIVWRADNDYEVVKVSVVIPSEPQQQIQFVDTLLKPLTGIVAPARLCKFNPETNGVSFASDLNTAVVNFEVVVPSAAPVTYRRYTLPTVTQYRSSDIWNKNGNDGNVERNFSRKLNRIDFQTGPVRYDSIQTAPTLAHGHNRLLKGRSEIAQLLGWLYQRQGRLKPFWIPSYESDFAVSATAASGQPVFTCKSFGYTANYLNKDGRRDIVIVRPAGVELYRITGATDDGTTETITLGSNLLTTLNTSDRVCFARFSRIDHDRIELAWHTSDLIQTQLKLRELFKTT